ncbi:hypothetical protein BBP40_001900 [Aspergillus hancockii]|nr:hypothetical protein BBP40_001900 [Aspergillus hancockii]
MVNASYRNPEINPLGKSGPRLRTDTQFVKELGDNGFTAIAFAQGDIIGTASMKEWVSGDQDPATWGDV